MMSRPMVLVFLLVILIITSQFEWKQQLVSELEASPSISQKQQRILNKEEVIKEKDNSTGCMLDIFQVNVDWEGCPPEAKIILSQEKNIQRLNELVQSLQQQLLQCQASNSTESGPGNPLTMNANEIERQQTLED